MSFPCQKELQHAYQGGEGCSERISPLLHVKMFQGEMLSTEQALSRDQRRTWNPQELKSETVMYCLVGVGS